MENLIDLLNYPEIKTITSVKVLQREAKIYFDDFENNKYEIYFPNVFDFRQCVEAAFISRVFKLKSKSDIKFSIYLVENSDWIINFIKSTDGVYGEDKDDYKHFILFESTDTRIEVITNSLPQIFKLNV
ncbi:hypothetical protein [Ruminococcus sp. Marseille-P6503]|uniref:hypothetical protein n=1 Tax=Ruminococcus sp. Marseille-P6503 TaxID=2364796 RepID=UPI000F54094B|nr:hypothetical protein [Ruminococcus sp. Marseille-P6503]